MGVWSRLFGAPEATKEAVKAVRDGLDALWYTDQERAQAADAEIADARRVLIEWVRNSQGQNLARRVLAFMVAFTWLALKVAGLMVSVRLTYVEKPETVEQFEQIVRHIDNFSSDMTPAVMLILGFYFAAPHMGRIAEVALNKFGERNTK